MHCKTVLHQIFFLSLNDMLAPALHILKRNKLRLTIFCICKDVCMTRNIKLKLKVAFLVLARVKGITSQLNLKPWLGFLWGGGRAARAHFPEILQNQYSPWADLNNPLWNGKLCSLAFSHAGAIIKMFTQYNFGCLCINSTPYLQASEQLNRASGLVQSFDCKPQSI